MLGNQVFKDQVDLPVLLGLLDLLVLQVQAVKLAFLDHRELQEPLAFLVTLVLLETRVLVVMLDSQVMLDLLASRAHVGLLDLKDHQVAEVHLDQLDSQDLKVLPVSLAYLVYLEEQVQPDNPDHLDNQDSQDQWVFQDHQAPEVRLDR